MEYVNQFAIGIDINGNTHKFDMGRDGDIQARLFHNQLISLDLSNCKDVRQLYSDDNLFKNIIGIEYCNNLKNIGII